MTEAFVAFGSNVGDRAAHVQEALRRLGAVATVERVSGTYETAPLYVTDQREFFNVVARVMTSLGPVALVRALKQIEEDMGRVHAPRNSPRVMDLDLVVYGSLKLRSSGNPPLQVPHSRMAERRFVLEPLLDAARTDDPRRDEWRRQLNGLQSQSCRLVAPASPLVAR